MWGRIAVPSAVRIKPELKSLKNVFREWTRIIDSMANTWDDDCPWWYRERSHVGLLSAATFLAGGSALEEYSDRKGRGRKATWKHGRVDLYLYLKEFDCEFVAEAKHCFYDLHKPEKSRDCLKDQLTSACDDVGKVHRYCEEQRMGIVFAVPHYKKEAKRRGDKEEAKRRGDLLRIWQADLRSIKCEALAWVLPATDPADEYEYKNRLYPGVAVLARIVAC